MLIEEMSRESSVELVAATHLGRLACCRAGQPYITPFSFSLDDEYLYGFTSLGQKVEWMRLNPLVCVEVDRVVARDDWQTVVIFGKYEELPDTPALQFKRVTANEVLSKTATWWEPGSVRTKQQIAEHPFQPVCFRISMDQITGHRAVPRS